MQEFPAKQNSALSSVAVIVGIIPPPSIGTLNRGTSQFSSSNLFTTFEMPSLWYNKKSKLLSDSLTPARRFAYRNYARFNDEYYTATGEH